MTWLERFGRAFGQTAFLFVIASVAAAISIFDSDENFSSFSRDIFYRVFAPLYPGSSDRAATVVLLNDASFRNFDTFPVKYGTHALILSALLSFNPRAVFVDFAFIDNRPDSSIAELKNVLEDYYKRNIRVYLPAYRTTNTTIDRGIRPDLAVLADSGRVQLVSIELGRTLLGTPLYSLSSEKQDRLTASAQVAKDFFPNLYNNIKDKSEFEIWWGLPPASINCDRANKPCPWNSFFDSIWGSRYSFVSRLWDALDLQFAPFATEAKSDAVDMPYSPIVYVNELLNGNDRQLINPVLNNKFIYYGADIAVARDNFPNPVFSYRSRDRVLPGIFFHAMAIENIYDLKEHIKIALRSTPRVRWERDVISIAIICFILCLWRTITGHRSKLWDSAIIVAISVAIAIFEFFVLNRAPSNWIGVFSFAVLVRLARSDELFDASAAWIRAKRDKSKRGVASP